MEIFDGLTEQQVHVIQKLQTYRQVPAGKVIFAEGTSAKSLYVVLDGEVEIFRDEKGKGRVFATVGRHEVFGEMGILVSVGRTATARARVDTLLMEIPRNAVELILSALPPEGAIRLLQNLFCILSDRLFEHNSSLGEIPQSSVVHNYEKLAMKDIEDAYEVLERNKPKGLTRFFPADKRLEPQEVLFDEGDQPDGFYFISEGEMDVIQNAGKENEKLLSHIVAPTVTGETGFFSGKARNATIRATSPVVYSHFTGSHFKRLVKSDPEEAVNVLFAAAQMTVYLMLKN